MTNLMNGIWGKTMSDHKFDIYAIQEYIKNLQQRDESEVWAEFEQLPRRTREIIITRLQTDPPTSFAKLGKHFGISRQRVHELFHKGIKAIREGVEEKQQ